MDDANQDRVIYNGPGTAIFFDENMDQFGYTEVMMVEGLNIPDGGVFDFIVDVLGGFPECLVEFDIVVQSFAAGQLLTADFDLDSDVDGDDLADPTDGWEARFGTDLTGINFLEWQGQFGSGVGQLAISQVVPDPSTTMLLLGLAAVGFGAARSSTRRFLPNESITTLQAAR